jgi:hypothetical protein
MGRWKVFGFVGVGMIYGIMSLTGRDFVFIKALFGFAFELAVAGIFGD